jgi:HlyB family type I secretion system ABC transporter
MDHIDQNTLTDKRRRALLTGLDISEQNTSPLVASVIEQRERLAHTNTAEPLAPKEHEQPKRQKRPLTAWKMLQAGLQNAWRRKVPQLAQMTDAECGAACLAMVLSYYGRKTSVSEIRERCGVGRDGLSARSIVRAARDYGMRVRAVSLQENDFRFVSLPAIVHWEFNHFLVVERWSPKCVDVVDPALGRRRMTAEEFDLGFTGVVIILEPGAQFIRHNPAPQLSLRTYVARYVKQAPMTLVQVIAASLLLQLFGLVVPILTKVVVDQIIPLQMNNTLTLLGVGMLLLLLSQLVTTLLRASLLIYLQARVDTSMMLSFFEHLLALPQHFFQQRSSGDILSRLSSNTVIRDTLSNQLVSTALDGSFVTVYLLILFWQSSSFGMLVLLIGLLQVILLLSTNRPIRNLAIRELMAQGKSQGYVAEALNGILTLKAAGAEQRALQHWSNLFFEQLNVSMRRNYLSSLIDTAMTMLRAFSPLALLWIGATQVINGSMQVGTMLALNALATAFLTPLSSLVSSGQKLQLVHSHLERIADVVEAEPEQHVQFVHQPPKLTGRITLENISFRYDAQSPDVLHNICVQIEPGQKVAIVGRTGSGKSTLGRLLLGLHLPTQGEVLYDGIPLRYLNYQAVRAQFGVVMQDANVFSGSIRQNIAFNDPGISMERVIQAAQAAALHEDVMRMPMGYETFVSERGSALSGGQRQRLALARALAHAPAILLLDEATSHLDVVIEQIVERNINALACTQIIIAHRLSTIRHADLILVLDQGTIVERGRHQELLQRNGYYAKLIQSQLENGEMKSV